jgi:hypothetical protein
VTDLPRPPSSPTIFFPVAGRTRAPGHRHGAVLLRPSERRRHRHGRGEPHRQRLCLFARVQTSSGELGGQRGEHGGRRTGRAVAAGEDGIAPGEGQGPRAVAGEGCVWGRGTRRQG